MTTGPSAAVGSARAPIDRIGVAVLRELVEMIVTGAVPEGGVLPPEAQLSQEFGVSRTVIRETMKRLQEKGMVTVAQGRGTHVNAMRSWNLMDPLILSTLIGHDDTLGILDELSVVRGALESAMAAATAKRRDDDGLSRLRATLQLMRDSMEDSAAFRDADIQFHIAVMELSDNTLAESLARVLFERALESSRYHGIDPEHAFELTMREHELILAAIEAGDAEAARAAMDHHILGSWERRRLPTLKRS
ncbi:FCD domain-containing protein [Microbacterium sp. UBA3394]|uniref:FadR/GntR family transcriptional regulator n=1 Tax=Microbacterium sp. UBA3394 TaxID=1946945 RepID=UPI000C8F9230|nr:FCD domain-containing protein [Microbacterium sp. UBA3394]MAU94283.1 GntR family transcriptional regulator [Fulvimarina sp.]|tara:strand:+ start:13051 stop:13794 length:744 start_codon:yes stop_codon:yes gene_type:complete